jgi:hypothetical protein
MKKKTLTFDDVVNLGGNERTFDERDFSLEKAHELLGSATARPDTFQYPTITQVWQKAWPACGAHAAAHLKEIQEGGHLSPAFVWKKIKLIDGYFPEQGTDLRSIFKVLQTNGICLYDLLPNDYTQTLAQYTDASVITKAMEEDAQPRIIKSYAFCTDLSVDNLKTQIYLNKAVPLLIKCDDGFFGTKTPTFTTKKYGHFVIACGYDAEGIWVVDSTEKDFPYKYIDNKYAGFIVEAGTTIDLPNEVVTELQKQIKGLLEQIIDVLISKIAGLLRAKT